MTVEENRTWPALPLAAWSDTYATLHMWTQIVGKIRLALAPPINHWWNVTLYVTCRGLTTSNIPYGTRTFQLDFDLRDHRLEIGTDEGGHVSFPLRGLSVADFYRQVMGSLEELDLEVSIWPVPVEVPERTPFDRNTSVRTYDPEQAQRVWQILLQVDRVFTIFRSSFLGKSSPSHFFWGAFDLAVTRFSGRKAPRHPGSVPNIADFVMHEGYSHELSSAGFWPGGAGMDEPIFYAYVYPEPDGFKAYPVEPEAAYYHSGMREFILPYEAVRSASEPDAMLLKFLRSTYEAAAETGGWDRAALERPAPLQ